MFEALLAALVTLTGLWMTIRASGRLFRGRKALREEMELYAAWAAYPTSGPLRNHIEDQLCFVHASRQRRERRFRGLLMELLGIFVGVLLAFTLLLLAIGSLDLGDLFRDSDLIAMLILGTALVVAVQRVVCWWDSWRSSGATAVNESAERGILSNDR